MRRRLVITLSAVLAVVCIAWSLSAPWATTFPVGPDHYSVSLFGVTQISDISLRARKKTCEWNDPVAACFPAQGEDKSYASLARARWFVFAGLGMTLIGLGFLRSSRTRRGLWRPFPFVIAGLLLGAAIMTMSSNLGHAVAAFAGARVSMSETGTTAAGIGALLCFIAGVVAAMPRSHHHRTRVRRMR
jgi:hypothetical protein